MQKSISSNSNTILFNPEQKPVALVFSGGGGRALVHLGIWKALEEVNYTNPLQKDRGKKKKGLQPQKISGVSMGAIIGAMWAAGYSATETIKIFELERWTKWIRPTWRENGLISIEKMRKLFSLYLPHTFEELKTPLVVSAFCLQTASIKRFERGDLISPLLASMAVPAIFPPVRIEDKDYVDSGLIENLPIKPLFSEKKDYFRIGIHSNPLSNDFFITSTRSAVERYFQAVGVFMVRKDAPRCDLYLEPSSISEVKFSNTDIEIAKQIGYDYAQDFLRKLSF